MSPRLLVSPFVSAAVHQSIKTNQQRQKENKGLGKEEGGWGIETTFLHSRGQPAWPSREACQRNASTNHHKAPGQR